MVQTKCALAIIKSTNFDENELNSGTNGQVHSRQGRGYLGIPKHYLKSVKGV
jgi:hypothetical protein